MNEDFKKELLELLKKHEITSLRMLCYNDPDLVKQLENLDEDDYDRRYEEWVKDNPEPEYSSPSNYEMGYNDPTYKRDYKKWLDLFSKWRKDRDAALGPSPDDIRDELFREEYDEGYTPGLWYSSRC